MKKKLSAFEIVWYIICALLMLWGLTYIVLGTIANFIDLPAEKNALLSFSNSIKSNFKLDALNWGLIIFAIGMALAIIVLLVVASRVDKTSEKAARRAQRLAKLQEEMSQPAAEKQAE